MSLFQPPIKYLYLIYEQKLLNQVKTFTNVE